MVRTIATMTCGILLVGAAQAAAQGITWTDKGFAAISVGAQPKSQDVKTSFSFPVYEETASVDFAHKVDGGGFWDLTGGYFFRKNLGGAISFSGRGHTFDSSYTGSIPSPVVFDQNRAVTGTVPGLKYSEHWFAILGVYAIPVTDKVDVFLTAGPAVASVKEDLVTGMTFTEGASGPVVSSQQAEAKKSFWGAQFGADFRYLITKQFGAGVFLRVTTASGNLTDAVKAEPGGFQIGFGGRARF